ncbi:MAG: hypothetical protein HY689_00830 [Chloroflexi bacterium]|nr:hypothetical protein [Chloroflexota bacterium]
MTITRQGIPTGSRRLLWFGLFGGHAAWTLQLIVNYFLASLACQPQAPDFAMLGVNGYAILMVLVSAVTGAVALAATVVAFRRWRWSGGNGGWAAEPARWPGFVALAGFLLSGLFFVVIVAGGMVNLFLAPCIAPR